MAATANTSSRRSFLAAAALAPVVVAAPAFAAPTQDIASMIAEYWRLWAVHEHHPFHDTLPAHASYVSRRDEADALHDRIKALRKRILDTPSRSGREVGMKLEMVLQDYKDCVLDEEPIEAIKRDAMRLS